MGIRKPLSLLLSLCKPGKPCRYGSYSTYTQLARVSVPRELFDENLVVLYSVAPRLMGRRPYALVFSVSGSVPEHPFNVDLPDIDGCEPGVCVDGLNVPVGDYRSYMFSDYAMYMKSSGGSYLGVLLTYRPIRVPGTSTLARARNKLRMWRFSRRVRKGGSGDGAG